MPEPKQTNLLLFVNTFNAYPSSSTSSLVPSVLSITSSVQVHIENITSAFLFRGLAYTLDFAPGANTQVRYRGHAFYLVKT